MGKQWKICGKNSVYGKTMEDIKKTLPMIKQ